MDIPNFDSNVDSSNEKTVPMSKLRQTIARRLKDAQNTAAILTTFNEVDMSAIMNLRKKQQAAFQKKHEVKLGIMSFFIKACVDVLKEIPEINSEIYEDKIIYKNYFDILTVQLCNWSPGRHLYNCSDHATRSGKIYIHTGI